MVCPAWIASGSLMSFKSMIDWTVTPVAEAMLANVSPRSMTQKRRTPSGNVVPGMVVVEVVVRIGGSGSFDALSVVPQAPAATARISGRLATTRPDRRGRGRAARSIPVMAAMIDGTRPTWLGILSCTHHGVLSAA